MDILHQPVPWAVINQMIADDQYLLWRQIVHSVYIGLCFQPGHEAQSSQLTPL